MTVARWAHFDDLPLDQLDAIVLGEDGRAGADRAAEEAAVRGALS
jgi:hypothetical protein